MTAVFRLTSDPVVRTRRFNRVDVLRRLLDAPWTDRDVKRIGNITDRYPWGAADCFDDPEMGGTIDRLGEIVRDYRKIAHIIQSEEDARKLAADMAAYNRIKARRGAIKARYEAEAAERYKSRFHQKKLVDKRLAEDREYQALEWEWGQIPKDVKQKMWWLEHDARHKTA